MRRVSIIGGPGSGKSTLARAIGAARGLPVHHLDRHFWSPGWELREPAAFLASVRALTEGEAWVIEGNYSETWPERFARSDTLVFLDLPTGLRLWRVLARIARTRGQVRPDMAEGCPEQLDPGFLRYVVGYARRRRGRARVALDTAPAHVARHHLRRPREVDRFLAGIGATPP